MDTYKLQTVVDGKVIKESDLKLSENDRLIIQPNPSHLVTGEGIAKLHRSIEHALSSDSRVLVIPPWVELKVLTTEK